MSLGLGWKDAGPTVTPPLRQRDERAGGGSPSVPATLVPYLFEGRAHSHASPLRPRNSLVEFLRRNAVLGTGTSRAAHSGSHPSLGFHSSKRPGATPWRTDSLWRSQAAITLCGLFQSGVKRHDIISSIIPDNTASGSSANTGWRFFSRIVAFALRHQASADSRTVNHLVRAPRAFGAEPDGGACGGALVKHGDWRGREATLELLALSEPSDAVFCRNDMLARGPLVFPTRD